MALVTGLKVMSGIGDDLGGVGVGDGGFWLLFSASFSR